LERFVVRILAGHVRDGLTHRVTDACPDRRGVTGLELQELTEHGPSEPGREPHDCTRIGGDVPPDRELHQMAVGPMRRHASALTGRWAWWPHRVEPLRAGRNGSLRGFGIVGRALDVVARSIL